MGDTQLSPCRSGLGTLCTGEHGRVIAARGVKECGTALGWTTTTTGAAPTLGFSFSPPLRCKEVLTDEEANEPRRDKSPLLGAEPLPEEPLPMPILCLDERNISSFSFIVSLAAWPGVSMFPTKLRQFLLHEQIR